ncbi:hypothetical protein AX16_002747 [Volvariella volvacea WC 439]|nr:hypothetical protein AX16_002747 [Volvariella volvacea WC 439]
MATPSTTPPHAAEHFPTTTTAYAILVTRNWSMTTDSAYKRRLHGWLSYAIASEAFVIVSVTLFLPICLEQFARDNGFLLPDKTERCVPVSIGGPGDKDMQSASGDNSARCVVKLGWWWVDSASFSLYVYSISVALQALTVISMGGIADYPPFRKRLLLGFGTMGFSAAILFLVLPSTSPVWFLSALFAITANVGFGASFVAMNAFLPSLAKDAPEVKAITSEIRDAREAEFVSDPRSALGEEAGNGYSQDDLEGGNNPHLNGHSNGRSLAEGETDSDTLAPLIQRDSSPEVISLKKRYDEELSRATSRISSLGVALGYGAGILMAIVSLVPVTKLHGSTFSLRLAIGLSGVWWALWTIPAAIWLPGGRGGNGWVSSNGDGGFSVKAEVVAAWKKLGGMLWWSEIVRLRNTFKFLAAWFLLSDGFTTITSTALLFAKTTLNMPSPSLLLIGILTPLSGITGSLAWPYLQKRYKWSNLKILTILVVMISMVPIYGCLGFLPIFQGALKFGGLTTPGEMYVLAVYFGSLYGAFQGYARAFYAELLPPGEEARWFGLFSVTDKSSSFLGPLVVGVIADLTGNIRYAFFFLAFMIWLAVPILSNVDVEGGRKDARAYVGETN